MAGEQSAQKIQALRAMIKKGAADSILETGIPALRKKLASEKPGGSPSAMSPAENKAAGAVTALFETVLLLAADDGEISAAELARISSVLTALIDGAIDRDEVAAMMAKYGDLLGRDGFAVRASYLQRSLDSEEVRGAAFELAAGIALLEADVDGSKDEAFELLADALDLPADEAEAQLAKVRKEMAANRA